MKRKKFILPTSWLYYLSCLARKLCWLNLTMAYMCISDKWLLMVSYLPCKLCKKTCDSNQQKNRHPYRILRIVHHCHENTHNKKVNFHQNKVKRKIKCLTSCQDLEKKIYYGSTNCFLHTCDNFSKELKVLLKNSKNSGFMTLRLFWVQ